MAKNEEEAAGNLVKKKIDFVHWNLVKIDKYLSRFISDNFLITSATEFIIV